MEYETMTFVREGSIGMLTFSRPEKLNAINRQFHRDLTAVGLALNEDNQTRVVIVAAKGRAFSAGADLAEFPTTLSSDVPDNDRIAARMGMRALRGFAEIEQITVAAVDGWAIGGGLSVAMACDIRIAAEGTRFYIPEVDFGMPYMWTSTALLTRMVGPARAKELILTCDHFSAQQALQWGLVNSVVPREDLLTYTEALASKIAAKPYAACRQTKLIVNALSAPFGDIAAYDAELGSLSRSLGDFGPALDRFLKRK